MKKIVFTKEAPEPIGPYSQAVIVGGILYSSGQIAIDPLTNKLITETIELETKRVMENIKALLSSQNLTFEAVFKATIFISDMDNFGVINSIYGSYFNEKTAPARETVEVSRLPKDVNVEISIMASIN